MNLDKFTQKSQEAIFSAQQIAQDYQHQAIEPAHLLLALIRQREGIIPALESSHAVAQAMVMAPGLSREQIVVVSPGRNMEQCQWLLDQLTVWGNVDGPESWTA